jgi:flagellin
MNVAKRNANDAISMVQIAEGGMNEMGNILIRMRELTVQAASDTIGDKERSFLNREYTQLADEIDRIAATTEFNGNKFFVEQESGLEQYVIQVGTNGTDVETNQDTIAIDLTGLKFTTEDLGIGKGSEIGSAELGEAGPSREEIAEKLGQLDDALFRLASERATVGSIQSRLNSTINNISIQVENMNDANSRIKDVDFASETAMLSQNKILQQSNVSVLSQANVQGDLALALLR